jgi:hypothetical protein
MFYKIFRLSILLLLLLPQISFGQANSAYDGYIFLQVQSHGEAWYVYPSNGQRYYLGRPDDALTIMSKLSLGVKHDYLHNTEIFPDRLSGLILLDTEQYGQAWYIYPGNKRKYYLGRPDDAFRIMRELGRGIINTTLEKIPEAGISLSPLPIQTPGATQIIQSVPFTSQAPFGDWQDIRQEDGCEEASSLMAIRWATNATLNQKEALKEILGVSDYILEKYQEFRDVSPEDTLNWIIKDYFAYQKAALKKDISLADIIEELNRGNVIIAPMDGKLLNNPYYTPPGPPNHMILIYGYDSINKIFITNDPGTRRGKGYRYNADLLYQAIRAYPTGSHETIEKIEKDAIVVWQ